MLGRMMMAAALTMGVTGAAHAQTSRSASMAGQLSQLLQEHKMKHVAAADPGEPGRYVAAMLLGDTGLFVVSARYTQPVLINERLYRSDHEGVYMELNGASQREGKLFVQDLGRPGLHARREPDSAFDIAYDSGTTRTAFDGDWKAQGLTQDAYQRRFEDVDARYAAALAPLVAAVAPAKEATQTRQ